MSKNSLKKYVKTACLNNHFKYLIREKNKMSKGSCLNYSKLETQKYLKSGNGLSVHLMRSILQTRIRDLSLKCNFRNAYQDTKCLVPECIGEDETKHVFECQFLGGGNEIIQNHLPFEDLYGCDVKKQINVMNILKARLQHRSKYLAPENKRRGPGGPRKGKKVSLATREAKQKNITYNHK